MRRDLTIVIPAYEGAHDLHALLAALDDQAASAGPLPVLVVDDASPRPLETELGDRDFRALELRLLRSDANRGPGASRNRGLGEVETTWVVFLDADELPAVGWLQRLTARLSAADPPDVLEGRIVVGAERATPFTHIAESEGWQHVAGNVAYRVDALRNVGGFSASYYDPARKLHFREDTELYFRLEDSGLRLEFDEDLVANHPPRPASFRVPLRDARRYFFDPLLSRDHPERFRAFVSARRARGLPLRWARHQAAVVFVVGLAVFVLGLAVGNSPLLVAGAAVFVLGWAGSLAALAWGRRVRPGDVLPLLLVSALVPWVYLWNYYRGVLRFRHRPRLR
jgi:glycosyltransferase involved in cell wall biosynthesis